MSFSLVTHGLSQVFLHNFDYFPTPYNSGSAVYQVPIAVASPLTRLSLLQLSTIVLFAKATLEFFCQERLLPAIVVTNDWFAGLTSAYARYGAFGSTFDGTTFFHLVHNLEEGYEVRLRNRSIDTCLHFQSSMPSMTQMLVCRLTIPFTSYLHYTLLMHLRRARSILTDAISASFTSCRVTCSRTRLRPVALSTPRAAH